MRFSLHDFIMKGLIAAIGVQSDYWVILEAARWYDKGVLEDEDLIEIQRLIDEKNTPKPEPEPTPEPEPEIPSDEEPVEDEPSEPSDESDDITEEPTEEVPLEDDTEEYPEEVPEEERMGSGDDESAE